MIQVSCGKVTSLPTAVITPCETITVAFSMRGPETGTTVAPRIAKDCGSPPCAFSSEGAANNRMAAVRAIANDKRRRGTKCIPDSFIWVARKDANPDHRFCRRIRLVGSYRGVKNDRADRTERQNRTNGGRSVRRDLRYVRAS